MTKRAQMDLFLREEWDNLIVLDACRYDLFEELHPEYFSGELMISLSAGSSTPEWANKSFGDGWYPDIDYVSANPHINSLVKVDGFHGRDHFSKVVDVWDHGWNGKVGTVLPSTVRKSALEHREDSPDKRMIVHFMQPHGPYLDLISSAEGKNPFTMLRILLADMAVWILGKETLRKLEGFPILSDFADQVEVMGDPLWMKGIARKYGEDFLHNLYENNLRRAIEEVVKLLRELPGRTVITSDHGERLGENGEYGHEPYQENPILREVPWLVVD
ncbi:MAG: hypothetical protein ACLFUV_03995 [Methanomassiliicoccales archaeon]